VAQADVTVAVDGSSSQQALARAHEEVLALRAQVTETQKKLRAAEVRQARPARA
jgi:hypothetical protein